MHVKKKWTLVASIKQLSSNIASTGYNSCTQTQCKNRISSKKVQSHRGKNLQEHTAEDTSIQDEPLHF